MGIEYRICCLDCKVSRDVSKFSGLYGFTDFKSLAKTAKRVQKDNPDWHIFSMLKITDFVGQHGGHALRLINDCSWDWEGGESDFPEDYYLWKGDPTDWWTGEQAARRARLEGPKPEPPPPPPPYQPLTTEEMEARVRTEIERRREEEDRALLNKWRDIVVAEGLEEKIRSLKCEIATLERRVAMFKVRSEDVA